VLSIVFAAVGCTAPVQPVEPPALDLCVFRRDVYPILGRDCSFAACHGAPERFFRVYSAGRSRLDVLVGPSSDAEIEATFERARSMLASSDTPEDSLFLRKPLELSAGGAAHAGRDRFGRNIFASRDDPSWMLMAAWANGAEGGTGCE
jgi:hypothetical protein